MNVCACVWVGVCVRVCGINTAILLFIKSDVSQSISSFVCLSVPIKLPNKLLTYIIHLEEKG